MEARATWIILLVLLGVTGGFYFLFPRISRRGLLFGVYVGEDASQGDAARRITNSWYLGMTLWLVAAIAAAFFLGVHRGSVAGNLVALFLLPVGFLEEYLRAYTRARRLVRESPIPQAAAIIQVEESKPLFLPYLAMGFGLAGGLYSIGYAWAHYAQLPNLVPVHFGLLGSPDIWRRRSFSNVMMLPIMSLIMGVAISGMAYLVGHAKRAIRSGDKGISFEAQLRFRRIMANYLAIVSLLLTTMLCVLAHSTMAVAIGAAPKLPRSMMVLSLTLLAFSLAGGIYIAVRYGQGGSRLEKRAADHPLTDGLADNRKWVLGVFYVDRDDPSIFVERRFGLGYTINFGNPKALALFFGFVGLVILLIVMSKLAK